jgi:hypothetical protein
VVVVVVEKMAAVVVPEDSVLAQVSALQQELTIRLPLEVAELLALLLLLHRAVAVLIPYSALLLPQVVAVVAAV